MKKKTIKITSPNVPQRGSTNPMILIALPKNLISIYSEVSQVTYISPDGWSLENGASTVHVDYCTVQFY